MEGENKTVKATLIYKEGVDLTFTKPCIMDIQSCMAARYDAGVVKHQKEHTGVIEIWQIKSRSASEE